MTSVRRRPSSLSFVGGPSKGSGVNGNETSGILVSVLREMQGLVIDIRERVSQLTVERNERRTERSGVKLR